LLQDIRGKSTDSSSKQPLSRGQRKRTEAKKKVAKRNVRAKENESEREREMMQ